MQFLKEVNVKWQVNNGGKKDTISESYQDQEPFPLEIYKHYYMDGNTCLLAFLKNGEQFGVITLNVPEIELEEDEVVVKNYSENRLWIQYIFDSDVIIDTGKRISLGYIENLPVCKLNM